MRNGITLRLLAAFFAIVMLCSCSKTEAPKEKSAKKRTAEITEQVKTSSETDISEKGQDLSGKESEDFASMCEELPVSSCPEKLLYGEYSPEEYCLYHKDVEALKASITNLQFADRKTISSETVPMISLPVEWKAGWDFLADGCAVRGNSTEKQWNTLADDIRKKFPEKAEEYYSNYREIAKLHHATLTFITEDEKYFSDVHYVYTVSGNELIMKEIEFPIRGELKYLDPDHPEIYHYGFRNGALLLEKDGSWIELKASYKPNSQWNKRSEFRGRLKVDSLCPDSDEDVFQNMESFSAVFEGYGSSGTMKNTSCQVCFCDGNFTLDAEAEYIGNDRLHIRWKDRTGTSDPGEAGKKQGEMEFRYLNGELGITIIDDEGQAYHYNTTRDVYNERRAGQHISDNVSLSDSRGIVRLDSSILFAVDSSELTGAGKDMLDTFFSEYVPVILEEIQAERIRMIEISGHTDPDGSHDYNQTLSEKRAEAVADYLKREYPDIEPYLTTVGCSYDRPVLDSSGVIDKAASRRVEFLFVTE